MYRRDYIIIWLVSIVVLMAVSVLLAHPGYMDAFYYYHVAENVAQGRGLVEEFVWNYLPPPEAIIHSSNTYWMPLVSLLAASFMAVFGLSFRVAQFSFILLSSLAPVMTATLAWRLTSSRSYAIWSALFTLFGGFYLVHWIDIDSFGVFAICGGIAVFITGEICALYKGRHSMTDNLLGGTLSPTVSEINGAHAEEGTTSSHPLGTTSPGTRAGDPGGGATGIITALPYTGVSEAGISHRRSLLLAALVGLLTALAHLSRADGPLLLVAFGLALLLTAGWHNTIPVLSVAIGAYLLAMTPWLLRNILVVGTPLPPQGASVIFTREYNDLYSYGVNLSLGYLLDHGLWNILVDKASALWKNLVVFNGGALFLLPFTILGAWSFRKDVRLLPLFVYSALLYLTFSLIFTHPGVRGSMIHSAVVLLPWTSLFAVHGIYTAIAWMAARRRDWKLSQAQLSFTAIALLFSALMALYIAFDESRDRDRIFQHYIELSRWIDANVEVEEPIMLTNPPAYAYISQRPSIATPSNGVEALLAAADRYDVSWLALEFDHAKPLDPLYYGQDAHPRLEVVGGVGSTRILGNTRIYRIRSEGSRQGN